MTTPATASTAKDTFVDCPRCDRPLRFDRQLDGPPRYRCTNGRCGFESTQDRVVEGLLHELRRTHDLLAGLAKLALPGVVRELVVPENRCRACETKVREALVAALDRADARIKSSLENGASKDD